MLACPRVEFRNALNTSQRKHRLTVQWMHRVRWCWRPAVGCGPIRRLV
jgi:hypothetical protein